MFARNGIEASARATHLGAAIAKCLLDAPQADPSIMNYFKLAELAIVRSNATGVDDVNAR